MTGSAVSWWTFHARFCQALTHDEDLYTVSAIVTKFHPTHHQAVHRHYSGCEAKDGLLRAEFLVDLMPNSSQSVLGKERSVKVDTDQEPTESFVVVLDTAEIQRTPWLRNTLLANPANFKLTIPDVAYLDALVQVSGTKGQKAEWPARDKYEPLLNLSLADCAAQVDFSEGRFPGYALFAAGKVIDGQFYSGEWFGDSFCMGRSIGARLIDGKEVLAQFVGGQYQPGLAGKFCEGRHNEGGSFTPGSSAGEDLTDGQWGDGPFCQGRWVDGKFEEGRWKNGVFREGTWISGILIFGASGSKKAGKQATKVAGKSGLAANAKK
jgi:hypothetical protein